MSSAITQSGWYRAGPKGLERVCGLEETPEDIADVPHISELVKVELAVELAEVPLW